MPQTLAHPANDSLKAPLAWSLAFHLFLFGSLLVSTLRSHRGELWGGPGGAVTIGLVGNLAGVPLPKPDAVTTSRVVDETKGLYQSEPKPNAPEPAAEEIPEFAKKKPQKYITRPSRTLEDASAPPPNAVPYGEGGSPAIPYTQFTMAGGTQGGMGFTGPGGEFGGRFPSYVLGVRNRISTNWLQSTVDPTVRWAPRAIFTFQILRDGGIVNIQKTRSSGNDSVDRSALRAILSSSPLDPLPAQYTGSFVTVEFWFDFRR